MYISYTLYVAPSLARVGPPGMVPSGSGPGIPGPSMRLCKTTSHPFLPLFPHILK